MASHQLGLSGTSDDPTTWYLPQGDIPDDTEVEFEDSDEVDLCEVGFMVGDILVVCTRPERHEGSHVAGDGSRIIAIWDQQPHIIEEEPV